MQGTGLGSGVNAHGALEHRKTAELGGHRFPKQVMGRGDSGCRPQESESSTVGTVGQAAAPPRSWVGKAEPSYFSLSPHCAAAAGHWQGCAQCHILVTVWGTSVQCAPSQRPPSHSTCFTRSSCLRPAQSACRKGIPAR